MEFAVGGGGAAGSTVLAVGEDLYLSAKGVRPARGGKDAAAEAERGKKSR
jgi:hypothetical protein